MHRTAAVHLADQRTQAQSWWQRRCTVAMRQDLWDQADNASAADKVVTPPAVSWEQCTL